MIATFIEYKFVGSIRYDKDVAPGILGGAPLSPYPRSGGMISFLFSPIHMLGRERKREVKQHW